MTRERLRDRRWSEAIVFERYGSNALFTVSWSPYPDGRIAEMFLNVAPSGGELEKSIRDAAVLVSFALQHGAPLDALVEAVTHESDGTASSIVGQALMLVREAIGPTPDAAPVPVTPIRPKTDGGDASAIPGADAVAGMEGSADHVQGVGTPGPLATLVAVQAMDASAQERDRLLEPADPKEAGNDGDPIRAAHELWPACVWCGCRHAATDICPRDEAGDRLQEDRRTRVLGTVTEEP